MNSKTVYQTVGSGRAQWNDDSPLRWTMLEQPRKRGPTPDPIECDLSSLRSSYSKGFLLALKDALISSIHRIQLRSIHTESVALRLLLARVYEEGLDSRTKVVKIDSGFLVALHTKASQIPATYLAALKRLFESHRDDERLFEHGLQPGDFPSGWSKRGSRGDQIHAILAKALHRSTVVHVLDVVETAFEEQQIDLGRYAFTRLALNIFCRPDSYRQLTLSDLRVDKNQETGAVNYFLNVVPVKSRVRSPRKISHRLHPDVGRLLAMQRQHVVEKHGQFAPTSEVGPALGQLALFPALKLQVDGSWVSRYASTHGGMLPTNGFESAYLRPVKALTQAPLTFTALRHTIGTQLALMGCAAHTIQAVLKHASDKVCRAYVDIAFDGLIDKLSDGMKPGFDEHFPAIAVFTSKADPMPLERQIVSEDLETGRMETTAMCGRTVACSYAPIVCYACPRFIPCYDADHSINLNVVDREIKASEGRGRAMEHDVQRWKTIRNHIRLVIVACDKKRSALEKEARPATERSA